MPPLIAAAPAIAALVGVAGIGVQAYSAFERTQATKKAAKDRRAGVGIPKFELPAGAGPAPELAGDRARRRPGRAGTGRQSTYTGAKQDAPLGQTGSALLGDSP